MSKPMIGAVLARTALAAALAASCVTSSARADLYAGGPGHAAALIPDGTVLVTGGAGLDGMPSAAAMEYRAGQPAATGSMAIPRSGHTATSLFDGRVLVAGGTDGSGEVGSLELYDPSTGLFLPSAATLRVPRQGHEALGLADGRVLVRGGQTGGAAVSLAEIYDPRNDTVEDAPPDLPVASVATDQPDYLPGDTVYVSGSGWQPGDSVDLLFDEEPLVHAPAVIRTVADASGEIHDVATYHVDDLDLGTAFTLHAGGATSGISAQVKFTDGDVISIEGAPNPNQIQSIAFDATQPLSFAIRNKSNGNKSVTFSSVTATLTAAGGVSVTPTTIQVATAGKPLTAGSTVSETVQVTGTTAGSGSVTILVQGTPDSSAPSNYCDPPNPNKPNENKCTDSVTVSYSVTPPAKLNQTITFGALADRTYGSAPFTVSATASSGLPVSYASSGNCTVSGATVTIADVGTCSITAKQAGDPTYNAAADVTQSFAITQASQTISFGALGTKTWGDPDFAVTASASSGLAVSFAPSGNCTMFGATVHLTGAGSCTITASQAGNANYLTATSISQAFTILKAPQTISFGALATKTYGDPDFAVSASASSGLAVTFAASGDCTTSGATVHISGAGSCTITASQAGNDDYLAASDVPQSFTIDRALLTITADDEAMVLHASPVPTFTWASAGFVNGESASVLTSPPTCTSTASSSSDVGAYPISCSGADAANYRFTYVDGTLRIVYATGAACLGDPGHAILQPILGGGKSVWKAGSTVPAKFRVCDAAGISIGTPGVVAAFFNTQRIAGTESFVNEVSVASTTADAQFRWDPTAQQWIFNISTKGFTKDSTYAFEVRLKDGSAIPFAFGVK